MRESMMEPNSNLLSVYQQLCISYQEIDTFRSQLLGRLPLATGAGIFLFYVTSNQGGFADVTIKALPAIGLFGFVVTLGLFAYEIYGIMKCHALILGGKQMEAQLGVDGQFAHRPRSVLGQINEPFAAGVIYPAVLASWAFVALVSVGQEDLRTWCPLAVWIAVLVFFAGFASLIYYNVWLKKDGENKSLEFQTLQPLRTGADDDAAHPPSVSRE